MHQIDNIEDGKDPDNYINPSDLPDIDRHTLKRFFLVIGEIQSFVGDYFHLNLV
jgi:CBS domain-containing protein